MMDKTRAGFARSPLTTNPTKRRKVMRNLLIAIIVVVFAPFTAGAFTVSEEAQVIVPKTTATAPTVSTAGLASKRDVGVLSKRVRGLEGQTGRILTETRNNSRAIGAVNANMEGLVNAVENTATATGNLSRNVRNVQISLAAEAKNLGDQAYSNALLLGIGGLLVALLAVIIIVVVIRRSRTAAPNVNLDPIETRLEAAIRGIGQTLDAVEAVQAEMISLPQKTAIEVKRLDEIKIELSDVVGHKVSYIPPIENGTYISIYVPSTVSQPVANPSQINRVRMTDKAAVRRSLRKTLADYFLRLESDLNPTKEQDRQQKALVEHLIATGELVID